MTDRRARLPSVGKLLERAASEGLFDRFPRSVIADALRSVIADVRAGAPVPADWLGAAENSLAGWRRITLKRTINATGVVLHTNLGRAPLAAAAIDAMVAAMSYSILEFDPETGRRGSRQSRLKNLLRELTGAEDALVTVNAAAGLLLTLDTLAARGGTVISRGELVEIGGSFRLPDIIQKSGSKLIEVGTTNRTHRHDYQNAIDSETACLLKVHRSNFSLEGFVSEVDIGDLVALGHGAGLPVVHDVGSGLLADLAEFGLSGEPLVKDSVSAGAITVFSGDKLLGGPQAGIILGETEVLGKIAANPLARAVRPDKATIGALEATLVLYRDRATALREIPVLRMLTANLGDLKQRARRLARLIPGSSRIAGQSAVGGGSFPHTTLPTELVAVYPKSCDALLNHLRAQSPPIVARAADGAVVLDVRTLADADFRAVAEAVNAAPDSA